MTPTERALVEMIAALTTERNQVYDNLRSTQTRCTELLEETRAAKRAFAYLESRVKDYPILEILLAKPGKPNTMRYANQPTESGGYTGSLSPQQPGLLL